jgi:4-oxalocrotonate tautomerase
MPVIVFEGRKLKKEQKEELIRGFTEVAHRVTGIPKEAFTVFLKENEPDNVGVGGEPLSKRLLKQEKTPGRSTGGT